MCCWKMLTKKVVNMNVRILSGPDDSQKTITVIVFIVTSACRSAHRQWLQLMSVWSILRLTVTTGFYTETLVMVISSCCLSIEMGRDQSLLFYSIERTEQLVGMILMMKSCNMSRNLRWMRRTAIIFGIVLVYTSQAKLSSVQYYP